MDQINQNHVNQFIENALAEDVGSGDHTTLACIPEHQVSSAYLLAKDLGIIAGVELAKYIFTKLDSNAEFELLKVDGQEIRIGDIIFQVTCNTRSLLKAERLVLNMIQRMSGIASLSNRFAFEVEDLPVKILDTRKTTPLLRYFEKWAVKIGGCENYRFGLFDRIMIKDNHIMAAGSIAAAIDHTTSYLKAHNLQLAKTIEVRNLVELHQTLQVGNIDRIMLDNFELPLLREAVATIDHRFETEASGGVSLKTVRKIAKTGVDFISVGALTHSAGCLDLSLKIKN